MGEKITDERIVEYIWLHADEPSEKIHAGILKEFGVERRLDWVTKERVDYLNAAPLQHNSVCKKPSHLFALRQENETCN